MGIQHRIDDADRVLNTNVTIGSSSTAILTPTSSRKYTILVNNSDEVMYLAIGADAVMNKGIPLYPNGGSLELNGDEAITLLINGICASGSKNLTYFEAF